MQRFLQLSLATTSILWLAVTPNAISAEAAPVSAPTAIEASSEWIPLRPELEIEPGSALDFSQLGFTDAPAGKYGYVIAGRDGQFAFEKSLRKSVRFYGINLCFGAHYLSHDESDRLSERLVRLGYNALRIHHYERELTQGQLPSTTLNPRKLEQFDYLTAALIRRGIYLTTDLFVSREVAYRDVGIDKEGKIPMDTFKILVPVHAGAYENWKQFSKNLLGHTNAYTGRRYADEPGLACIAMINEGNFGNFFADVKTIPEWKQAWNHWLAQHYSNRDALGEAWGGALKDNEVPAEGTVEFPEKLQADGSRVRDCVRFLSSTEREMVLKMKAFLRDELGCKALVSNASSWTRFATDQSARDIYDYVDDHFYVDHPQFLEGSWRLPSRCPNTSPILEGAPGGRQITFTRLFDKPFTVTEYNYSGPGRFRGVGGILTGAMGALQGWRGIWRFAYSHSREAMFTPSRIGYFDVASDPLSQAAERASLCLFLRRDLKTAPESVVLAMTESDLATPSKRIPTLAPKWHWLAWCVRVGTEVVSSPDKLMRHDAILPVGWQTSLSAYESSRTLNLDPYTVDDSTLIRGLGEKRVLKSSNLADPAAKFFRSSTGEITIDGRSGLLVLDTARTAGGYAPAGQTITTGSGSFSAKILDSDATVWVSALDERSLRNSRRLLVTHLTDLQNTRIRYAEVERKTLLGWGELPYLVRTGKAEIRLQRTSPRKCHVWALSPSGKRLQKVLTTIDGDKLCFTLDIAGEPSSGARMLYEVARE